MTERRIKAKRFNRRLRQLVAKPKTKKRVKKVVEDESMIEGVASHWGGEIPEPDKFFGFCYHVTNMVSGRLYIGKKQYYMSSGKCKRRCNDRSSEKWRPDHWKESNWRGYTGSSKELNADIKELGKENFRFEIMSQHVSKAELHYAEVDWQVHCDVLRHKLTDKVKLYYNKCIAGVKFLPPPFHSPKTIAKLKAVLKERGHPMQGKVHPNKGKKLPQTAPHRHVSIDNIQITDGRTNLWWPKGKDLPTEFKKGITKKGYTNSIESEEARKKATEANVKAWEEKYEASPKFCLNCGVGIPYVLAKKKWKTCSPECRSEWRSKCSKKFHEEQRCKK